MNTFAFNRHSRLGGIVRRLRRLFLRFIAINAQGRIYKARREAERYLKR